MNVPDMQVSMETILPLLLISKLSTSLIICLHCFTTKPLVLVSMIEGVKACHRFLIEQMLLRLGETGILVWILFS